MKIRITLEVGDELRRAIALTDPALPRTDAKLATHEAVGRWLVEKVYQSENAAEMWLEPDHVTREEESEARLAIEYLRAAGWPDERIVRWIMAQRAYREKIPLPRLAAEVIPFPLRPTFVEDHEDGTD